MLIRVCQFPGGSVVNNKMDQHALRLIELIYDATQDEQQWLKFLVELTKVLNNKSALLCLTGNYPLSPENEILNCSECGQAMSCQHAALLSAELGLLRLLAPHVIRAVHIRCQVNASNNDQQTLQAFVNCLSAGVIIVNQHGNPLTMNSRAKQMIAQKDIALKNGQVELLSSSETKQLQKLIADTTRLKKYRVISGVLDSTLHEGSALKILIVPLVSGDIEFRSLESRVALFICSSNMLHLTCQQVSTCYALTKIEASLVVKIIDGLNIRDSAKSLGLTYSTARTYLKQIFSKLGIKRQSELTIRILTGILAYVPQDSPINNFRKMERTENECLKIR